MMKIIRVLNNNAVVILDQKQEKIAIGPGVGFNKSKNDFADKNKVEKLYILKENDKLQQLILRIPEEHIILSEEIIDYAESFLDTQLNEHVQIALIDHISFAIEREKKGIQLKNKLLQEVKVLYKREFEVGLWAVKHINEKFNIDMAIDEAAFIALYIHTMKVKDGDLRKTVEQTEIVSDMVKIIKDDLKIEIEESDISYDRLITHLRFALIRSNKNSTHTMDKEIFTVITHKFSTAYQCALKLAKMLSDQHEIDLPEDELGYITLHIERLRQY